MSKKDPNFASYDFMDLVKAKNWMPTLTETQKEKVVEQVNRTVECFVVYNEFDVNVNSLVSVIYTLTDNSDYENIYDHIMMWLKSYI